MIYMVCARKDRSTFRRSAATFDRGLSRRRVRVDGWSEPERAGGRKLQCRSSSGEHLTPVTNPVRSIYALCCSVVLGSRGPGVRLCTLVCKIQFVYVVLPLSTQT